MLTLLPQKLQPQQRKLCQDTQSKFALGISFSFTLRSTMSRSSDFLTDQQLADLKNTLASSFRTGCSVAAFIAPIVIVTALGTIFVGLFRR